MFGYAAVLIALASEGLQLAAGRPVVRRVADEEENQATVESGTHCVVWGDWAFEGKKFDSDEEAAEYFTQKKRTELAAIHLHGGKQVSRHMSKRLSHVDWAKMTHWCDDKHASEPVLAEAAAPQLKKAQVSVGEDGAAEDTSEREERLVERPVERPKRSKKHLKHTSALEDTSDREDRPAFHPKRSTFHPKHSTFRPKRSASHPPASLATSSGEATVDILGKASSISGKALMLDKAFTSLSNKVSGLLKNIGVEAKGGSMLQSQGHHHEDSHAKLRSRLASLEDFSAEVQEKTNLLETEMFGTTTEEKSLSSHKGAGHSVKAKIDALAMQADELKGRLSGLESSPLLGEAVKLEETAASLGSQAGRIFESIGVESIEAPAKLTERSQPLKTRLSSLEGYVEGVQRNAAKLEYELLENSESLPISGDSHKAGSIKDYAASLGDQLRDLESRISSLGSAPIVSDVGSMEQAATSLASRLSALSKNVEDNAKVHESVPLAPKGSALKKRMTALGEYIDNMQTTTAALEEELAGNAGAMPSKSRKDTLKNTARFMEQQVENMNARIAALEQQV